jgi:hypothetical protein
MLTLDELKDISKPLPRDYDVTKIKEYYEKLKEMNIKFKNGYITQEETDMIMQSYAIRLKYDILDTRKTRKYGDYRALKIARTGVQNLNIRKGVTLTLSMDEFEKVYTHTYTDIALIMPSEEEIYRTSETNLGMTKRYDMKDYDVFSYISLNIKGPVAFDGYTKKIIVLLRDSKRNPNMYKDLIVEIDKVLARLSTYEDENISIYVNKASFTLTLTEWKSIDSWFDSNSNVSRIRKYRDFELFTAPDKNESCVKQCVEFLGGVWNPKYSDSSLDVSEYISKMLPQRLVITYVPIQMDMNYVFSLEDFITSYTEDMSTTDCKNVARLVKFKGHLGVISKIKIKKKYPTAITNYINSTTHSQQLHTLQKNAQQKNSQLYTN